MVWGLLGALAAAVCFGVATVLQAMAVRTAPAMQAGDPRLLLRLAAQLPFVAGLLLDLLGFLAELAALRTLPLFVVQAVIAAELAVTAVVAGPVLGVRLARREWAAVAAVCAGLALLGASAGHEGPSHVGAAFRWALLGGVAVLLLLGLAAGRLSGTAAAIVLGSIAGLAFGIVAIAARVLTSLTPASLLTDPAAYALAAAGATAFLFYAAALQRGPVTPTMAALVVTQTAMPAAIGLALLGDHSRPGFAAVAAAGFVAAVAGALTLARFGEPTADSAPPAPAATGS